MSDETTNETTTSNLELAAELTIAWLGNPNTRVSAEDVPAFLKTMHVALAELSGAEAAAPATDTAPTYTPAVSPRSSVKPDHIISLIDGKPYKMLKRHLFNNGLTPVEYRQRYGLKADYPMVAPNYAQQRRELAVKIGLGRKAGTKMPARKPRAKAAPKA